MDSTAYAILRVALCVAWMSAVVVVANAQTLEEGDTDVLQATQPSERADDDVDVAEVAKLVVRQTNALRLDNELPRVDPNAALSAAAQCFADYMARTDRYGHHADGKRPAQRANDHGYEYCVVAENIAYAYKSNGYSTEPLVEEFVEGWKGSPPHRENMLNRSVTETGVAVAYSETTGHWYAVQMFGLPRSAAIEFTIMNESETAVSYSIGKKSYQLPPRFTRRHRQCRQRPIEFGFSRESEPTETKSTESGKVEATIHPESGDRIRILEEDGERQVVRSESS